MRGVFDGYATSIAVEECVWLPCHEGETGHAAAAAATADLQRRVPPF